jgi:hypothetical protein
MSREMSQAWKNDQRVKTLKLVIQVKSIFRFEVIQIFFIISVL